MARHEAMNAKAKAGGIDLIYIGDSIVEFFETQGLDIFQRWEKPSAERDVLAKANEIISRLDDGKTIHFTVASASTVNRTSPHRCTASPPMMQSFSPSSSKNCCNSRAASIAGCMTPGPHKDCLLFNKTG